MRRHRAIGPRAAGQGGNGSFLDLETGGGWRLTAFSHARGDDFIVTLTPEPAGASPPTIDEQARALGCSRSTLLRHRRRGLPPPRAGERLSAWRRRAASWQAKNVSRPGRRHTTDAVVALCNLRRARAQLAELRLVQVVGQLHDVASCAAAMAARAQLIEAAFGGVATAIVAAVPQGADRHTICEVARRTIRAAHQALLDSIGPATVPSDPQRIEPAQEPPESWRPQDRSEFWLAVWRSCRVESERRALARERGDQHDAQACERAECCRIAEFVQTICHLPDRWGSTLLHQNADATRARVAEDLARAFLVLRGQASQEVQLPDTGLGATDSNDETTSTTN